MFGIGRSDVEDAAAEQRDKTTDQLSAPAVEEHDDLKLHAHRCGLRYYQTRAEIRYARADIKRVRAEIGGVRLMLLFMLIIMVFSGYDGAIAKVLKIFGI